MEIELNKKNTINNISSQECFEKLSKETNQLILSYTMFNTTEQLNSKLEY